MRSHRITGGGGVGLHVTDQGAPDAPAILFVHGWAQAGQCWQAQDPLAEKFRLIAMDLRGHGQSDKPDDPAAYADTALWAEDVNAVITNLGLDSVVLVGWSYGARVMAAYLEVYGDRSVSGVITTGGLLALGKAREDWMVGKESPGRNPDLYADDHAVLLAATQKFVSDCTEHPLDAAVADTFLSFNMQCPANVRKAMFAADYDVRPVWRALGKPLLSIHGVEDRVIPPICGIEASEIAENGDLHLYEDCGHAPFIEYPDRFNTDLAKFIETAIGAAA